MNEATSPGPKRWYRINAPVFITSAVLVLFFVVLAVVAPQQSEQLFGNVQAWVIDTAGWFYVLAVAGFLVFVVALAFSSMGQLKLGPDHSQPDYSYTSWFAMLFSAGMGIGLMFFGVAEPLMHYATPPVGDPGTVEAARQAMRVTFFHWGMHAWAIYAVVALSLAYFSHRHGLPLTIRSSLYPLIGDRIYGPIGHAVDIFAVLGTVFGVATSLGLGVIQVNSGLHYLFEGIPANNVTLQMVLIAGITALATLSVGLGLDTGIKRVSELNMILAVSLLAFVLVAGPTVYLLQTLVQNTGMYFSNLFEMTFNLYAYKPTGWLGGWTLFYWGWWIAWSPFVGMFIARVSRGRTIREFVVGVLLVPLGFTFMWMTFFGNTALHMVMVDGIHSLADAVAQDSSVALFDFFHHLPFAGITSMIATLLVVTFFVTSADSGALVVDMLTSGGEEESPLWQRIFWASLEGGIAAALLWAGGLKALQAGTIASALPFSIIMVLMCWGMLRAMRIEVLKRATSRSARVMPIGGPNSSHWKARLETVIAHPRRAEVMAYLQEQVKPALAEVAAELNRQGMPSRVESGEDGRVWVDVGQGEEADFFYSVHPRAYEPPSFVLQQRRKGKADDQYYRAEVHLKEGGQGYDVMGWSRQDLINDVLDQYQRHLHFLHVLR
ncbi:BCCT family transporter [Pseudoxanthomonas dokdonensis]|uniref:Choline transporter n=1 Tax=Pseudoxanthomonas dokdonensis TaxID=344882 RepID=A0A0R0D261_9GAMM|nr:choline BCCT transporter BetT [Pseudoxanthomonas dokdonensis]KRG71667.1 choline transporter [Pseudoxanthomonas dokdonensis]